MPRKYIDKYSKDISTIDDYIRIKTNELLLLDTEIFERWDRVYCLSYDVVIDDRDSDVSDYMTLLTEMIIPDTLISRLSVIIPDDIGWRLSIFEYHSTDKIHRYTGYPYTIQTDRLLRYYRYRYDDSEIWSIDRRDMEMRNDTILSLVKDYVNPNRLIGIPDTYTRDTLQIHRTYK